MRIIMLVLLIYMHIFASRYYLVVMPFGSNTTAVTCTRDYLLYSEVSDVVHTKDIVKMSYCLKGMSNNHPLYKHIFNTDTFIINRTTHFDKIYIPYNSIVFIINR